MDSGFDLNNASLLDLFSLEVETQTEILTENLLTLENELQQSQTQLNINPILEALMRASHSIKGAARVVQIELAVKLAHRMEDCFATAMEGKIKLNRDQIDKLLQGVDFFQKLSQIKEPQLEPWLSQHQQPILTLINSLNFEEDGIIETLPSPLSPTPENSTEITVTIHPIESDSHDIELYLNSDSDEFKSSLELSSIFLETQDIPPTVQQVKQTFSSALKTLSVAPSEKTRFVRVSSDNLNRLMGLAGEALVEATFLKPFADSLLDLKKKQLQLYQLLEKFEHLLYHNNLTKETEIYLKSILQKERECRETLSDRIGVLEQFAYRSINLSDRLYREVIASQMRPFSEGIQPFPRLVRDLAKQLNKRVKLEVIGQSVLVDRDILKKLQAPLTHMLRNAIDHGIESPDERLALGKSPEGIIRLEATHRFGMLSITLTDDGRGINLENLRQKVIEKN